MWESGDYKLCAELWKCQPASELGIIKLQENNEQTRTSKSNPV